MGGVPVGDFDGDGDYLDDSTATASPRSSRSTTASSTSSTATPAAPRRWSIYTVRGGKVVDVIDRARASSPRTATGCGRSRRRRAGGALDVAGFLAGWLAEKIRLGEGADGLAGAQRPLGLRRPTRARKSA